MNSERFPGRELLWMTLPCVVLLLAGALLSRHPLPSTPPPTPPAIRVTPTPSTFWIKVKRCRLEPVNAENKKLGADTCVTIETDIHNMPPNVHWWYCRRLVATKHGKTRVLWTDGMPGKRRDTFVSQQTETLGLDVRSDYFLFKLRNLPPNPGKISFWWDALAVPARGKPSSGNEKYVDLDALNRAAKWGGLRLSRRLVVRAGN